MFVVAIFESSFGFTYVLFGAVVALYHVNDVFGVTVNVIRDRIGLVSPVAWNVYEVGLSDMYLQVRQFFPHGYESPGWLCCVRMRSLALTRKSLRFNVYKLQWVQLLTRYSNGEMKEGCVSVCE